MNETALRNIHYHLGPGKSDLETAMIQVASMGMMVLRSYAQYIVDRGDVPAAWCCAIEEGGVYFWGRTPREALRFAMAAQFSKDTEVEPEHTPIYGAWIGGRYVFHGYTPPDEDPHEDPHEDKEEVPK